MKQIKVKNEVGYVSLVGIIGDNHPLSFGNYFSIGEFHVLNMWYENLMHLNIQKEYLDAVQFGDNHIVIVDKDIPEDYLNDTPCFTGGRGMTKESIKELYEFMFPRHSKLKCLCCSSAKFVSVFKRSGRTQKAGLSLWEGNCRICDRHVRLNNDEEVNQEVWDKLIKIYEEAPSEACLFLAPFRIENSVSTIVGENFKPNTALLSRYAEKKVNKDFYGMIKINDLKEDKKDEE